MRIADGLASRRNNFDALRLAGALMVLISHSFALTGRPEPLGSLSGQTLGELGVSLFFSISGFLIAKSWLDDPALVPFIVKRALRLLPALIIAVLLTALVVGPIESTLGPSVFLTRVGVYRYIVENSVLYTVNGRLPGVFVHNVYPGAVNGSLWTLPVEAAAYAGVAVLGLLGMLRKRVTPAALSFVVLFALSTPLLKVGSVAGQGSIGGNLSLVIYLGGVFNAGILLYLMRESIDLRWDLAAGLAIIWIVTFNTAWVQTTAMVAIPYIVLVLAYRTPRQLAAITRFGDLSYGIYIYAFPVQQIASNAWGPGMRPGVMLLVVVVPVFCLAFLSWHLIESPALRLKRRLVASRSRAAVA